MFAELREGYCSLSEVLGSDTCSSNISMAHTIQKKGGLAAISESDHVLTVKPIMKDMIRTEGKPEPRRVGVNKASVFPGFCNKHDTEIFKPIEVKSPAINAGNAFLFSYRAIAYERFAKEAEVRNNAILKEHADRGQPYWKQAAMQSFLYDYEIGLELSKRDVNRVKTEFEKLLVANSFDGFHFCALRFDCVLPVVACCAFHPEFDLAGTPLQQLGQDHFDLDSITVTVTAYEGETIVVFGWIGPSDGPAHSLVESILSVEGGQIANVLLRLLFIHTENLFLKPSWWNNLSERDREKLNSMTRSGTPIKQRRATEYTDNTLQLFSAQVKEIVRG